MAEPVVTSEEIRDICVLGAGTMGHGIAHAALLTGYRVRLRDITLDAVNAAGQKIDAIFEAGIARGKLTVAVRDQARSGLTLVTDLGEAVGGADAIIEAIPERMLLKTELWSQVEALAAPRALLATNTSSLSLAAIAGCLSRPERLVGMHFFNPVQAMKLVEIVWHTANGAAAVATAKLLGERLGKAPILVRDAPGFASSRLGLVLGLEAMRMLEERVASAADIDTAMRLGYGHPMGPLELTDLVGLDVRHSIAQYLAKEIGPSFEPPAILTAKVAEGHLGKKTGQGFYTWKDGNKVVPEGPAEP